MPASSFADRYLVKAFPSGGVVVDLETGNYFQVDASAAIACAALVEGDRASAAREIARTLDLTPEHAARFIADTRAALDSAPVRGTPTGPYHFHPDENGHGHGLWHAGKRVLAVTEPDLTVSVVPGQGVEASPLLEFYVRAVAPKIMFTRGLSVLHASACGLDGTLIAFAGQSGAGKTTTVRAFVQNGAQPISEDLLVLKPDTPRPAVAIGGEARAHAWAKQAAERLAAGASAVSSVELATTADGPAMPLGEILFVDAGRRAGADLDARRLSDVEGLLALLANDFLGASSREAWRQFVASAVALSAAVKLFEVTTPLGVAALGPAAARYMSSWTS
jgi:hypothetical protein